MPETTVRLKEGLRVEAETRNLITVMDEPVEAGGTGTGPTPMEMLLVSLGGCTALTIKLYSARKGWPLEDVQVKVTMVPAERGNPDAATHFAQDVTLVGDLDDAQRERLHQIAGRCPVHRVLEGRMAFEERLTEGVA